MGIPEEKKITAEEFFAMTPEDNKQHAELHDGMIVNFASPGSNHQRIVGGIYRKIGNYIFDNKGKCEPFISPYDVKLDEYNVVQPDVLVVCDPDKIDDNRCNGAPDLVIEVTSSNWKDDYIKKLNLYSEHGVKEYWIVDPKYKRVIVYKFTESEVFFVYTFDQDISVGIFENKLSLNIGEMI